MILWHNPRCTKSRETLKLLQDKGHDPDIRLYLKEAPTAAEIRTTRDLLQLHTIEMVRTNEAVFKDLGLADADDDALITAMAANPILIERPILITDHGAAIGRPPENVLALL